MSFISMHFAAMVVALFFLYYLLPKKVQPYLLLLGSVYFYLRCSGKLIVVMAFAALVAFLYGKIRTKRLLPITIVILLLPLVVLKFDDSLFSFVGLKSEGSFLTSIALPLGISFYTLQLIGYCIDVYKEKYAPETNFLSFLLATCFFPQIVQGPIPRYNKLKETLLVPHTFDKLSIQEGLLKIVFGIYLKVMIADKAGVLVNAVYNAGACNGFGYYLLTHFFTTDAPHFSGGLNGVHYLVGGFFYSFQLFADFLSCVLLAQGVSLLFGIRLSENFSQPYFATSIKDFWRRWHMSLSSWLRDYVYIPLGGNRKGKVRTKINLLLTFFVSGMWHGAGFKYVFWGLMHGIYQVIGGWTDSIRNRFYNTLRIPTFVKTIVQRIVTFVLVMFAWIIFRADTLAEGLSAIQAIFFDFQAKTFVNGALFELGLNRPEMIALCLSIVLLMFYEYMQEKGKSLLTTLLSKPEILQYIVMFVLFVVAFVCGTYGNSYDASAFIYGGF